MAEHPHGSTCRIGEFKGFADLDRTKAPGFVHDNIWFLLNVDPAVEALRLYIGGEGRGNGNSAFRVLMQQAYVASNVDEFRRPIKLRERLIETEGPVFTLNLRLALSKLIVGLPPSHRHVLPRLDDAYVSSGSPSGAVWNFDDSFPLANLLHLKSGCDDHTCSCGFRA